MAAPESRPAQRTFFWEDCAEVLGPLTGEPGLELDEKRRAFVSERLRILPPLVFPIPAGCASLADYLAELPKAPGRHAVVLLQAGAASLGWFEGGEERATKSLRKYVVRGRGRAQPTHLATKGKSRYGSRLRLQNAQRLLEETNEKLREWWEELGPPDELYLSAPVRLWADVFRVEPPPPFPKDHPRIRIPLDLPRPTTEVLRRAYRALEHGRIEFL